MADYSKYIYSTGTRYISNCGSNEFGGTTGGQKGDQTGSEWVLKAWYSRPWNCVLRYPDQSVALKFAELACAAALNDNIGYDQTYRDSFWKELQKVGYDPAKITTPCSADCSSGVIAITKAVGYLLGIKALQTVAATYTGDMKAGFKAAGFEVLTASKYIDSPDYLLPGDVNLNESHHTAFSVTVGSKATFNPSTETTGTTSGGSTATADPKTVWDVLYARIGNAYGVAGLMGNLYAESALIPINLQDSYESKLGYTDQTYTDAVDSGKYTKFASDSAGYGLAQWTYKTRKQGLYDYCKTVGASIGNLDAQLEYLYTELTNDFSSVLSTLKKATSVKEASDIVLTKFEQPADQSDSVKSKRAGYGQTYYDQYAGTDTSSSGSGTGSGTTTSNLPSYTVGVTYTTKVNGLTVRTGAGTSYSAKSYSQLTANGQAHANASGTLKKGTRVTCQASKVVGSDVWIQIPSGWVAAYYQGQYYVA